MKDLLSVIVGYCFGTTIAVGFTNHDKYLWICGIIGLVSFIAYSIIMMKKSDY